MDPELVHRFKTCFVSPPPSLTFSPEAHLNFAVRRVSAEPPGDVLFIVESTARFWYIQGSGKDPISSSDVHKTAVVVGSLLLEAFINKLGVRAQNFFLFRPFTLGTEDSQLGPALSSCLRWADVSPKEIYKVQRMSQSEDDMLDELWKSAVAIVKGRNLCNACRKASLLQTCCICAKVYYCSRKCQGEDRGTHKVACEYFTRQPSSFEIEPRYYYRHIAPYISHAQELAGTIDLTLGHMSPDHGNLREPIQRLVYCGKDTPENIKTLFGSAYAEQDFFKERRLDILLNPPYGSFIYAIWDTPQDPSKLDPREPSVEEKQEMSEIRRMQEAIRECVSSKTGVYNLEKEDMKRVCNTFRPNPENRFHRRTLFDMALRDICTGLWSWISPAERGELGDSTEGSDEGYIPPAEHNGKGHAFQDQETTQSWSNGHNSHSPPCTALEYPKHSVLAFHAPRNWYP